MLNGKVLPPNVKVGPGQPTQQQQDQAEQKEASENTSQKV